MYAARAKPQKDGLQGYCLDFQGTLDKTMLLYSGDGDGVCVPSLMSDFI
jgi:hypothetical protein